MPRSGDRDETSGKTLQIRNIRHEKAPAQETILDGGFCLAHSAAIAFYPVSI